MWLITEYRPATLFSFKIGIATSTGGKTIFLPTPFAIRTALLDAAIRTQGKSKAEMAFQLLRSLRLVASPPERVVVTNLFTKVQKPNRNDSKKSDADGEEDENESGRTMTKSIAFREYAYLDGALSLAFAGSEAALNLVEQLAPQVNYFGKRGSFFQWQAFAHYEGDLPPKFIRFDEGMNFANGSVSNHLSAFPLGIIQVMDDWGEELTFAKVNVYSDERISIPKDRLRRSVIFPYRLVRSSRGFSYYEWQYV
ncbi:MAG: hypothetical protein ACUVRJ_05420 [Candidatus Villigracilaceae bacterium]